MLERTPTTCPLNRIVTKRPDVFTALKTPPQLSIEEARIRIRVVSSALLCDNKPCPLNRPLDGKDEHRYCDSPHALKDWEKPQPIDEMIMK